MERKYELGSMPLFVGDSMSISTLAEMATNYNSCKSDKIELQEKNEQLIISWNQKSFIFKKDVGKFFELSVVVEPGKEESK